MTMASIVGDDKIKEAASPSKNKLKEMSLGGPKRSESKPLGTEKTNEQARGIDTIILTMRMDNPYSLIRIGKRASGRFV